MKIFRLSLIFLFLIVGISCNVIYKLDDNPAISSYRNIGYFNNYGYKNYQVDESESEETTTAFSIIEDEDSENVRIKITRMEDEEDTEDVPIEDTMVKDEEIAEYVPTEENDLNYKYNLDSNLKDSGYIMSKLEDNYKIDTLDAKVHADYSEDSPKVELNLMIKYIKKETKNSNRILSFLRGSK